jgi:uncharacterized membrane protein
VSDPQLAARSRVLAQISLASAVALVALVLLLPFSVDHTTVSNAFLLLWGLFLLLAAIIMGVSLAYLFMTRSRRDAPSAPEPEPAGTPAAAPEAALRLLEGDERSLYRRILAAEGAILQKDLVGAGQFSASKVTRLLDRLEAKGLITRERHGMTNRVRLSEAWRERA